MATKRPSFLKRQKEQARLARANQKRQERLERKRNGGGAPIGNLEDLVGRHAEDEATVPAEDDGGE